MKYTLTGRINKNNAITASINPFGGPFLGMLPCCFDTAGTTGSGLWVFRRLSTTDEFVCGSVSDTGTLFGSGIDEGVITGTGTSGSG